MAACHTATSELLIS